MTMTAPTCSEIISFLFTTEAATGCVLLNFAKFTGKHLWKSFFNKRVEKGVLHNTSGWLVLFIKTKVELLSNLSLSIVFLKINSDGKSIIGETW